MGTSMSYALFDIFHQGELIIYSLFIFSGVIRQLTGSYLISIRLSAGIFIFAGAVLFLDPLAKKMMTKKKEENSNP